MRSDDIVPFAMKGVGVEINLLHVVLRDFAPGGIFAAIQAAGHGQAFRGRRLGDEIHDRFVVAQWLTAPIGGDEGKEAMLNLVPLAGARRKVADRNGQPVSSANCCSSSFHNRNRQPLLPPASAVIRRVGAAG